MVRKVHLPNTDSAGYLAWLVTVGKALQLIEEPFFYKQLR